MPCSVLIARYFFGAIEKLPSLVSPEIINTVAHSPGNFCSHRRFTMNNQPKKKPLNKVDQARKALPRHFRNYPTFALVLINVLCYTWVKTYITIDNLGEPNPNLSELENQKLRGERTTKWLRHKNEELNYAAVIV
jgi:hypothetical protein